MKQLAGVALLICGLTGTAFAQQQPTPAERTTTRPAEQPGNETAPRTKQTGLKERQRREQINDRRPTQEQPRRLRPDSLRRGGATDIDTLRR